MARVEHPPTCKHPLREPWLVQGAWCRDVHVIAVVPPCSLLPICILYHVVTALPDCSCSITEGSMHMLPPLSPCLDIDACLYAPSWVTPTPHSICPPCSDHTEQKTVCMVYAWMCFVCRFHHCSGLSNPQRHTSPCCCGCRTPYTGCFSIRSLQSQWGSTGTRYRLPCSASSASRSCSLWQPRQPAQKAM